MSENPRPNPLLRIGNAADRRQDNITETFSKLYNLDSTRQEFTWHTGWLPTTYIDEDKIRHRETTVCQEKKNSLL